MQHSLASGKIHSRKSGNFKNITFLPKIYNSVTENEKTLSEPKKI